MANYYTANRDDYEYTCAICRKKFTLISDPGYGRMGKRYVCQDCEEERRNAKKGIVDQEKEEIFKKAKKYLGEFYDEQKVKHDLGELLKMPGVKKTGIAATLDYWYKIKGNDPSKSYGGIGIVKHVYQQAAKYYDEKRKSKQRKIQSVAAEGEHDNFLFERKKPTVILKPPIPYYGKNDKFNLD